MYVQNSHRSAAIQCGAVRPQLREQLVWYHTTSMVLAIATRSFVKRPLMFPYIEATIPAFKIFRLQLHMRSIFLISDWSANLGTMMPGKMNTILWIYTVEHRQIWYEHHSTQKNLSFLPMYDIWEDLLLTFDSLGTTFLCCTHRTPRGDFWHSLRW